MLCKQDTYNIGTINNPPSGGENLDCPVSHKTALLPLLISVAR